MSTMETYRGHVRTPADAIILFEACRTGHLPRVQRRLSEKERQQIKSGSVFVWDEREAGMRRWTDGKSWSASRVSGSFLTYREMEGKRGGNGFSAPVQKKSSGSRSENGSGKGDSDEDGPDGYRYKPDGLMKQSFSITTHNGQHLHLISYYSRATHGSHGLMQPSMDPNLRTIRPAKGMYPESSVNEQSNVPAVTRAPMPGSPFTTAPNPTGSPYARSGPPHPQHYVHAPPSHVWPPTPMGTPPTAYSPYYPGGPPPPAYFIQPGHSPHYPPHYPPHGYAPPTYLDRPPPQLNNSGLPPPPPMPNSHAYPPHYVPAPQHPPSMSPRVQQAAHAGPPHAAPGLPPHPYAQLDPALVPNHQHLAVPHHHQHQAPSHAAPAPGPQLPQINGMGQAPPPPPNGLSKPPTPPASNASATTNPTELATLPRPTSAEAHRGSDTIHNTSSAKTFPSIHALVNGTAESMHSRHDLSGSRQGSRSPKNQLQHVTESRPGSDNKALRTLDKAFMV